MPIRSYSIRIFFYCILLLSFMWSHAAFGQKNQEIIWIHDDEQKYVLTPFLQILADPQSKISVEEARMSKQFQAYNNTPPLNGNIQSIWVKFTLAASYTHSFTAKDWLLAFHPYNTHIDLYVQEGKEIRHYKGGTHVPIGERSYLAPSNMSPNVLKISLPADSSLTLYAKITEIHDDRIPFLELELVRPELYVAHINRVLLFSSLIVGGVVLMIIMVIVLNLYLGHPSHYYYLLYLLTLLFVEALTAGADTLYIPNHIGIFWEWLEPWFFPKNPQFRFYFEVRWYVLIVVYFLFIRSYLDLKNLMPIWDKIMQGMVVLGVLMACVGFYVLHSTNFDIMAHDDFLAGYVGLFFLTVIVFLIALKMTGDPRGIFVILGFSAIILSSSPTLFDIVIHDGPSGYADSYLIIGLFVEKIIFTAALSFRQRTIEKKLQKRREEQKQLLARQNKVLEETVADRTRELVDKTHKLEEAIVQQKIAQSKLIDSEKMASIGQLTAGIAHEINNPINFVSSNVDSLWLDVKDIKLLLEKIMKLSHATPESELAKNIIELHDDLDTKFLFKEIIGLVEGIQYGADRTQEIVKGLREFSRMDEDGFKLCDIHACIESTLRILQVQVGPEVNIHKEFADIPPIKGIQGKLNQVFMNLIANAIQALDQKGHVYIKTSTYEEHVEISISDDGKGMSEEVRKKIFEPFFTTKDVGKGTGLGLFIVRGIVEQHKGTIEVKSEEGSGTEFILRFPFT